MPCQVGTIRQVHQRLQSEGFWVSEYTLRQWVKSGTLPAVFVGNKALISFANVRDLLIKPPIPAEHPQSESSIGG